MLGGLALVAALLSVTACSPTTPASDDPPAADLSEFHEQDLHWGACDPFATTEENAALYANPNVECATVEVPLDYSDIDGSTAQIAVLRVPAKGERKGSLLVNPGGPAVSGNTFIARLEPAWQTNPLLENFDIVGFDPRGVGSSTPKIDCFSDEEYDRGEGFVGGAVYALTSKQDADAAAQRCIDGSGGEAALTSVGSTNVVQDMDILRAAFGDEKLSFLGYSYGSEIAAMYATTFPENVRAIVLDGAVDPTLTSSDFRVSQFAGFQETFDKLAAQCAQSADCPLGTDPDAATDRLHEMILPLADDPVPTGDGRELGMYDALAAVTSGLYAEADWPLVIAGLAELQAGSGATLTVLRDRYFERGADGVYGTDPDANVAIRCMDGVARTPEEQTALAERIAQVAPLLDIADAGIEYHHECASWPEPATRSEPWLEIPDGEIPMTLTVSVTGDPATPHSGGVAMAEALGGSLLTVEGNQHAAYLLGRSDCVNDVVEKYLIDLEVPAEGTTCALPTP